MAPNTRKLSEPNLNQMIEDEDVDLEAEAQERQASRLVDSLQSSFQDFMLKNRQKTIEYEMLENLEDIEGYVETESLTSTEGFASEEDSSPRHKGTSSTASSAESAAAEVQSDEKPAMYQPPKTTLHLILVWLSMAAAIFSGASVGPIFRFIMRQGVTPCLAAAWRCQSMVVVLAPIAIFEACSKKENQVDWFKFKPDLPFPVIFHVIISGLAWSANLLFWIVGLQYISTYKASIIATSHPILVVLSMRLTGHMISWSEWSGVFIAFSGMFLSNLTEFSSQKNANAHPYSPDSHLSPGEEIIPVHLQLLGFFLCFLSAAGEVVVIFNRIKTRKYVPLMQYTTATSLVVAISAMLLSVVLEDARVMSGSWSDMSHWKLCYEQDCMFGWTAKEWILPILFFGIWVGAVCITGFNYAMQYIAPLVFSSLTLVDPAITAFLSWMIGVEKLPTIYSWLGGAVVIAGVSIISYGEHKKLQAGKKGSSPSPEVHSEEDIEMTSTHISGGQRRGSEYEALPMNDESQHGV